MKPVGTGLVEMIDDKEDGGMLCMDLIGFISDEIGRYGDTEGVIWEKRHAQARSGQCAYRAQCDRYLITSKKNKS